MEVTPKPEESTCQTAYNTCLLATDICQRMTKWIPEPIYVAQMTLALLNLNADDPNGLYSQLMVPAYHGLAQKLGLSEDLAAEMIEIMPKERVTSGFLDIFTAASRIILKDYYLSLDQTLSNTLMGDPVNKEEAHVFTKNLHRFIKDAEEYFVIKLPEDSSAKMDDVIVVTISHYQALAFWAHERLNFGKFDETEEGQEPAEPIDEGRIVDVEDGGGSLSVRLFKRGNCIIGLTENVHG